MLNSHAQIFLFLDDFRLCQVNNQHKTQQRVPMMVVCLTPYKQRWTCDSRIQSWINIVWEDWTLTNWPRVRLIEEGALHFMRRHPSLLSQSCDSEITNKGTPSHWVLLWGSTVVTMETSSCPTSSSEDTWCQESVAWSLVQTTRVNKVGLCWHQIFCRSHSGMLAFHYDDKNIDTNKVGRWEIRFEV